MGEIQEIINAVPDAKTQRALQAMFSKILTDAGTQLKVDGTAITSTAAEINRSSTKSGSVVDCTAGTLAVTEALHGDRIITMNRAAGVVATLPAATGTGNKYTFIIGTTATSNANIIKVANATDVMNGSLNIQQDTDADGTLKCWMAEVGDDTITLAGAATTGGIVGNRIECIDYAAGFWACTAFTISGGGSEVTPFSATVS